MGGKYGIIVDQRHIFPSRVAQSLNVSAREAVIGRKSNNLGLWIRSFEQFYGTIGGTVVDHYDFKIVAGLPQEGIKTLLQYGSAVPVYDDKRGGGHE